MSEHEPAAGYALLDHTADVGVRAWGPDPAAAFAQAALGLFAIVLDADPATWHGAGEPDSREASAEGGTWQALLVNWLAELLYLFEVERFVPREIAMQVCEPPHVAATLRGTVLASMAEAAGTAVKAVTYHQLAVEIAPARTELRVILDI
jgi:SHS2 domain-containing protein